MTKFDARFFARLPFAVFADLWREFVVTPVAALADRIDTSLADRWNGENDND